MEQIREQQNYEHFMAKSKERQTQGLAKSTLETRVNWTKDVDSFEKRLGLDAYNRQMRTNMHSKQQQ